MSDEYDHDSTSFTSFYPLLILLIGLVGWCGYQVYSANLQRSAYSEQIQAAATTIGQAQNVKDRYVALMKDLIDTSAKDANAAQIVKEAMQAGLLRANPPAPAAGAGSDATNGAAPAPAAK